MGRRARHQAPASGDLVADLTPRQREVLDLIAAGLTNAEIGERLGISLDGAKWHVSEVLSRLQVERREDAAELWRASRSLPGRRRRAGRVRTAVVLRFATGAVAAALAAGLIVLAYLSRADDGDETIPVDTAGPCDAANLVGGFLVLAPGSDPADLPDCVQSGSAVPTSARAYELDMPPGPYNQQPFEEAGYLGQRYLFMRGEVAAGPAFEIYRRTAEQTPPVIRGTAAQAVDYLPGPGVAVSRPGSHGLAWQETADSGQVVAYYLWVTDGLSGLTMRQAASLLVYFDGGEIGRWDPDAGEFVSINRPPWTYRDDASTGIPTGIPSVAQAISAFARGESLNSMADTVLAPCVSSAPTSLIPPLLCGAGQAAGTLIPAYLSGGCPDQLFGFGTSVGLSSEGKAPQPVWLYAVAEVREPEFEGLRYLALFTSGERLFTLALTKTGVAGIAGGGSCPTPDVVRYARTVDSWALPPLFPLPPE